MHESLKPGNNNYGGRGRSLVKRGKRKEPFLKVGERSLGDGDDPRAVLGGGPGGPGGSGFNAISACAQLSKRLPL